ncbi:MAG: hypothetical protein WDZ35_08725 [Crocinitomicaceae bacterium]
MSYRVLILWFAFSFISCDSDPWSAKEKNAYLNACRLEGVQSNKCECMMEETMRRYYYYEEAEKISFEEAVEIAELCKE